MRIWVDADACPNMIKDVLFKAANNRKIEMIFVANQHISTPRSPFLKSLVVSAGFDEADDYIVGRVEKGDLVITADIPLADEVITKGGLVVSPRGEQLTANNIKPRLNMRDFLDNMRSSGQHTGGQKPMSATDKQAFAKVLDKVMTKALQKRT